MSKEQEEKEPVKEEIKEPSLDQILSKQEEAEKEILNQITNVEEIKLEEGVDKVEQIEEGQDSNYGI